MAYVDYSSNWVLDQFFTFLQANQLGANDEHLYDSLAVEHNINTATPDGTHKTNSILGSYINTTPVSTGSQVISSSSSWTPTVGVYQVTGDGFAVGLGNLEFQIYVSGGWRSTAGQNSAYWSGGIFFCDGTNMRFYNNYSADSTTAYYQKF